MKSGWTSWVGNDERRSHQKLPHTGAADVQEATQRRVRRREGTADQKGGPWNTYRNGMIQGVLRRSMAHTRRPECRNPDNESGAAGQAVQVQRQARRGNGAQGGGHGRGDAGGLRHVHGVRVHAIRKRPIERVDHARHEQAHLQ